jgi:hypothetical protein
MPQRIDSTHKSDLGEEAGKMMGKRRKVGAAQCLRGWPSAVVYSTSKYAVTPIFAVDENGLMFVMKDDLEVIRRDG